MGLTSSIEKTFEDDDINYETNGNYSKWHDIQEELTDERLIDTIVEDDKSSSDDTELRETVSKFVDDIIEDAVSKYNSVLEKRKMAEEDMFQRIPSTDELYAHSLETHLEKCYEYKDEMRKSSESEERSESSESESEEHSESGDSESESEECVVRRRKRSRLTELIINLRDASMEFVEEMNGLHYYDDYSEDDDELKTINEIISQYLESEQPNIEELKRNCASLKTSYNVVCENMKGVYERHPRVIKFVVNWCLCYYFIMLINQYS